MNMNRRRFVASMSVLGAGAALGLPRLARALPGDPPAFPVLRAAGGPGDLGLAHGRTFAPLIERNLAFYRRWLSYSGQVATERLTEIARGFAPAIEERFPQMVEEMDGIARGAGLSLDDILLINARTDVLAVVENQDLREKVPACTALALFGRAADGPALALGQNWDWDPELAEGTVILRLEPDDAPALVTLTEAGMLAKIGFNRRRLGVCLNFLSHQSDGAPGRSGIPIHCLLRAVLSCPSLERAVATVEASPRCASANFLLAQHDTSGPRAVDLEITPDAIVTLHPDGGGLTHTNHFVSPSLATGCTSGRGPSTMTRYASAELLAGLAAETEHDPVARMQRVLVSREGFPYPISREGEADSSTISLAGVIMDLTRDRFLVTVGPPHLSPWIELPGVG